MKQKTYALTKRGESAVMFAQALLLVGIGFAVLNIFARVVVWLGDFLNII
jgi:hypothetical protein